MTLAETATVEAPNDRIGIRERIPFLLAALYLGYAAIQPPGGWFSFSFCAFHAVTDLPCPGCGLTRSLTALLRADAAGAWAWNPLGFAALPFLLTATVLAFGPLRWIRALTPYFRTRAWTLAIVFAAAALLVFGLARAAMVAAGLSSFPG